MSAVLHCAVWLVTPITRWMRAEGKTSGPRRGQGSTLRARNSWSPMVSKGDVILLISAGSMGFAAGVGVSSNPRIGLGLVITPPLLWWLFESPLARLLIVTVGALLVFQSQSSAGKYAYIALAGVCFCVSAIRVSRTSDPVVNAFRWLIPTGSLLVALLVVSMFVTLSLGSRLNDWSGDVLPYAMLVALPVVGLDAAPSLGEMAVNWLIGSLGVATALGFALDWINRRGVSNLGIGRVILASMTVPALGFAYSTVQAARSRRPLGWTLLSIAIAALLFVTGTRTSLVIIACYFGIVGATKKGRYSPVRIFRLAMTVAISAILLLALTAKFVLIDPRFLSARIAETVSAWHGGGDPSYQIRIASYASARAVFFEHPWLGGGPGHIYPSGTFNLDTPWMVAAKFGVIGSFAIISYLLAFAWGVRNTCQVAGSLPIHTVARGWGLILLVLTPFGPWIEDKGTALALALLIAAIAAESKRMVRLNRSAENDQAADTGRIFSREKQVSPDPTRLHGGRRVLI